MGLYRRSVCTDVLGYSALIMVVDEDVRSLNLRYHLF